MDEIWLDTNILRRWNLRLNTAEAEKFFSFCEEWGFRILLPEVALSEFVHHYVREARGALQAVERSKKDLTPLEIPVAGGPWVRPPVDLTSYYRNLLEGRFSEKSITIVPLGEVPTQQLFDMSVGRIPPFTGDKGERGLHDVLILFSMLEYAHRNERRHLVLITDDGIFRDEQVKALVAESGVRLIVHESVDAFITFMNSVVERVDQNLRREREARARAFLLIHRPEIERFIEQNAVFEQHFLSSPFLGGTVEGISGMALEDITEVTALPAESEEEGVALIFITFKVRLKILLEIEVSPFSSLLFAPKRYRVGQEPEQPVHAFGSAGRKTVPVTREVVCEATARERTEEKTFSNLELKQVKADAPFESLTRAIMEGLSPPGTSSDRI